jgi:hypothetical protein
MIVKWKEIGDTNLKEVKKLREKVKTLYEAVPPIQTEEAPNEHFSVPSSEPDELTFARWSDPNLPIEPFTCHPRRRCHPGLLVAGAVAGIGGTAFGIYNTVELDKIKEAVKRIDNKLVAFQTLFNEFSKAIIELRNKIHGIFLKQLLDSAFDTGLLKAHLRMQYEVLSFPFHCQLSVMQQALHRRLALAYLDGPTLKRIFNQAKLMACQVNCVLLIRQPSDLFQLELLYTYDGRQLLLMLHIPISPAESTMQLYQLHRISLVSQIVHAIYFHYHIVWPGKGNVNILDRFGSHLYNSSVGLIIHSAHPYLSPLFSKSARCVFLCLYLCFCS